MAESPRFACTVIVPTRERPEQLRRCVDALLALAPAGGETELIVVDDDPAGSARAAVPADSQRIRYVRSHGRGPAVARNLGSVAAHGDVLAFTDDDCEPEPSWLRELAATLAGSGAAAAAGHTVNGAAGACSEASQIVVSALQGTARHDDGPAFVASNNVCFRREPFLELGGFDERFPLAAGEDRDLCERWIEAGHRFAESPRAVVVHRHQLSLPAFWRQHYRYGHGAFDFHEIRRSRGQHALRLQPGFYRALGKEVRRSGAGLGRARLAGLAAFSQLANASGYAAAAISSRL